MSTVTRRKPSKARAERVIRPMVRDDEETRIVIRGVGWAVYDALSDAVPEGSPVRVNYDGKDIEIMALSDIHDQFKYILGRFVDEVDNGPGDPRVGLRFDDLEARRSSRGVSRPISATTSDPRRSPPSRRP